MSRQLHTHRVRLGLFGLVLFGSLALVACSASAGAATPSDATSLATPVPPAPGSAPAPGPLRVVPEQLISSLGVRQVRFVASQGAPVVVDAQIGASQTVVDLSGVDRF